MAWTIFLIKFGRSASINIEYCRDPQYIGYKAVLKNKGVIGFDYLFGEISQNKKPFDYETFVKSPIQFTAVVTNCQTGETEYIEKEAKDHIFAAVQASSSMPLFSQMVTIGESQYLDGAVSNAIPVKWALEQGYDKVIVVLTRDKMYQKKPVSKQVKKLYAHHFKEYPKLVEKLYTMPERYNQIKKDIEELEEQQKIFVFRPEKEVQVKRLEKDTQKLRDLYEEGKAETLQKLDNLREYLA